MSAQRSEPLLLSWLSSSTSSSSPLPSSVSPPPADVAVDVAVADDVTDAATAATDDDDEDDDDDDDDEAEAAAAAFPLLCFAAVGSSRPKCLLFSRRCSSSRASWSPSNASNTPACRREGGVG